MIVIDEFKQSGLTIQHHCLESEGKANSICNKPKLRRIHERSKHKTEKDNLQSRLKNIAKFSMSKSKSAPKTVSELLKPYESLLDKLPDEKPLKAKLIDTPVGQLFAVSNERAVVFLFFAESRHFDRDFKTLIKVQSKAIVEDDVKPLKIVESEIKAYFDGKLKEFETPYEVDETVTEFTRQVWDEVKNIKYGTTTTFAELAKAIGKPGAAQPVANASGRIPITLIIPNHRIVSANKKVDTNNSCMVRNGWLLEHESKFAQK